MLGEFILWAMHRSLYVPPSHLEDIKAKITIMTRTTTQEMEPLTRGIVIFGATGDLCKKKLIPALYKLWLKDLLPENFVITGCARRQPTATQWKESLGYYPDEFLHHLDYISADLDNVDTLRHLLITFTIILTSYLFLPKGMLTQLSILKRRVAFSMTQTTPELLLRNLLGPIINLLIVYSLWWSDIYARNKYIALTIILAKILLITYLLLGLVIFCWNHFGIAST